MNREIAGKDISRERKFLGNLLKAFEPNDGDFRPTPEMMSAAQVIRHIAQTTRWFMEGAYGKGFEMDFEKFEAESKKPCTLEEALAALNQAYDDFLTCLDRLTEEDFTAPLPPNPIFGEIPRFAVIYANSDHTAHHRGALAVYLRLLGKKPPMIYAE